ncbi:serine/threonine-protein phosphatase 4 regulatory subunit 1-like isoform X2 [Polyodon spathula]|uniref:serine/threonine-protein phosphatase 4 regulatory subunit 1-like isoform X2 n=1 Tax=Polyodon spathula TaxID=7913 RepID=UPI001B7EB710|nr:serine/threonine-protein phosphatase 4 regulatory subunit 1-like isoform X2 [Polyodon spathula]
MADLSLLQEDLQEDIDGFGVDDYSSETDVIIIPSALDFVSQDEMLTPLGRLDKYAASENIFNRQMVARTLLDTLKAVSEDEKDCITVLERVSRLADDSEPTVRAELMEQVPHIAIFCQENRPSIPYAFSKYLLPIVVAYLADQNNQVRKTSQAALLVLLEQELLERCDIETKVCPVLVDLIAPDSNDDVKTEAMAIICKMAPMVGKDITERHFLPRFCEMCCDCRMFHVRKVCAANFGDICTVVGREATEELLLPRFFQLCSDNVWGVRKACAECFMTVSSATSQGVRMTKLSCLFINLISDPSRWVRQAAFQSLGQFISTFANPASSGQYFKEEEEPGAATSTQPHSSSETGTPTADSETKVPSFNSEVSICGKDGATKTEENGQHCYKTGESLQSSEILQNPQSRETEKNPQCCETRESELCCDIKNHWCCRIEENQQFCDSASSSNQQEEEEEDSQVFPPLQDSAPQNCGGSTCESQPLFCTSSHSKPADTTTTTTTSSNTLSGTISKDKPIPEQELYNSFHYWRNPLPLIDLELELQQAQEAQERQKGFPKPHSPQSQLSHISPARRKELEEMIENLEPHVDDPDVKAQVDVLTATLRASMLESQLENSTHEPFDNRIETRREAATPDHFNTDPVPLITDTADKESLESPLGFIHGDHSQMSDCSFSPEEESKFKQQDVVPQALLDQYLSMTDPSRAQTVDTEIAKHCAHSLPGVALTLGRQNWHCLKDTYETLASDMQWKVRRTLAFSIHELAIILGDQLTAADLVPVFNGFLKDLDEVRIGVLRHLYDFLKLLHKEMRREYLYQLQEFLVTDNSRNWRFRAELAEQLVLLLDLYCSKDVYDYLRPLAFSLCTDKISSVRCTSYKLIREIIRKLSSDSALVADFMAELVAKFCYCPKWSGRQAFAFVCQSVIEDDCVSMDLFAEHMLPPLLQLASDPVPNVRVLLAKILRHSLLEKDYFIHSASSHQEALEQTLVALQMDLDKDVQYFASVHPASTRLADDAMSTTSSTY